MLNRVQSNANGVNITIEGDFGDVGKVYHSDESTANILSCAVMVNQGNYVRYDQSTIGSIYDRLIANRSTLSVVRT